MSKSFKMRRSHYAGELSNGMIGQEVVLNGWVQKSRDLGGLVFADLRDRSGFIQIVFDESCPPSLLEKAGLLAAEYVIGVKGKLRKRSSVNSQIKNGDIEVIVSEMEIFAASLTPPIYIKDDDDVNENTRLKYRYLDLRKPSMQRNFLVRHQLVRTVRNFLSDQGFIEIETPILNKPTPEGARDFIVPSRINHGKFYSLPQSPQLFKQILMISGFDKYYQIAKCFRDEDLRADRQPEFTQIDLEMSFVEEDDVMEVAENLIARVFDEILGIKVELPLMRMDYDEAMEKYGSDKPDLRFGMEIKNVTDIVKSCGFKVFESAASAENSSVRAINVSGGAKSFTRKEISKLEELVKSYGAMGLAWLKFENMEFSGPIAKFLNDEVKSALTAALDTKNGDLLLFVADKNKTALESLGRLRCECADRLGLLKADDYKLLFVVNFPQFEYSKEEGRYVAMHHPFTMIRDEDMDKLKSGDLEHVKAKAYDMVLNGVELGGGSIRIHDSNVQKLMFKELQITDEDAQEKFGFLVDALKYGAPPHGGLAFGLDRLCMLLLHLSSIRDVIAFPKTQNAACLMTGAPGLTDEKSLEELGITLKND